MDQNNNTDINNSPLSIPPADLKIIRRNGVLRVFDRLRKNYFNLTEEEFVRQTFVNWLIESKSYPPSLMANEIGITLNGTYKRCDTVVYSPKGETLMIIEYKAPRIRITQDVFDQIVRYNMVLNANYIVVTNGKSVYCCRINKSEHNYEFVNGIPDFSEFLV